MATAAVIGLTTGKRLLNTSIYSSELSEKLFTTVDYGQAQYSYASSRTVTTAKRRSNFSPNYSSDKEKQGIRAVKEDREATFAPSTVDWFRKSNLYVEEGEDSAMESSLEAIILLQRSMLEKQWNLSSTQIAKTMYPGEIQRTEITRSGLSARQRRNHTRRKCLGGNVDVLPNSIRRRPAVSPELQQSRTKGYIRGNVCEELLSHAEVARLSKKIKAGLSLEDHKKRLEEKLGYKPSDQQLAYSLQLSHADLQSKMMECSLAREKLAMNNVRLVRSIAQKYENMGAEMADLVQGGLIGLLRGIEKYDSSKGFRISTYVYWWIRQGVSRALVDNSRTLRLPLHLHERLSSIKNAKIKLEEQGISPTLSKIAGVLNMSERKVRNATEAVTKVFSLDREAFPSLNGIPGKTLHSYIADTRAEFIPWHGFEECYIKDEVTKLLTVALGEREQEIVRLYYGFDSECHSWEDISRQMGLSRERVRQVGLVAMEKLKHAARRRKLEAMLVNR